MLSEKEIKRIAQHIIKENKKYLQVRFLAYKKFIEEAKKSPLIRKVLEEGSDFYELNVPSIFSHKTDTIYFNKKILAKLLRNEPGPVQKKFIKAITYHELFHFLNKKRMNSKSIGKAIMSENKAEKDFKKLFPQLAALAARIARKGNNE